MWPWVCKAELCDWQRCKQSGLQCLKKLLQTPDRSTCSHSKDHLSPAKRCLCKKSCTWGLLMTQTLLVCGVFLKNSPHALQPSRYLKAGKRDWLTAYLLHMSCSTLRIRSNAMSKLIPNPRSVAGKFGGVYFSCSNLDQMQNPLKFLLCYSEPSLGLLEKEMCTAIEEIHVCRQENAVQVSLSLLLLSYALLLRASTLPCTKSISIFLNFQKPSSI